MKNQNMWMTLWLILSLEDKKIYTVKRVLMATSEQRPPANNSQPKPGQINFTSAFD
jgi:hypothetical protein